MKKSLLARSHDLAQVAAQRDILEEDQQTGMPSFSACLKSSGLWTLKPLSVEIFQVNVGKMCNQVCKHCHVDAGPDRKEIMTRETMEYCLRAMDHPDIHTVDLTGGAPEMNPDFRWFVERIAQLGKKIIVRCNLTIIVANKKYFDLPDFFKAHGVNVVSSLPHFSARRTDAQRGEGVFERSIRALKMLNDVGYGQPDSGLKLDLVYNPAGAFLPDDQEGLRKQFAHLLDRDHGIVFNELLTIANLPISRFLEYLLAHDKYEEYMRTLIDAYNPAAAAQVMCRSMVSVGWDGSLYDCDFNQMLEYVVDKEYSGHVRDFSYDKFMRRNIIVNQHCFGCTAGAGSSCGGALAD